MDDGSLYTKTALLKTTSEINQFNPKLGSRDRQCINTPCFPPSTLHPIGDEMLFGVHANPVISVRADINGIHGL
jgi:hypothetical protein